MKKYIYLIPVVGIMMACDGGTTQTTETKDVSQEKTQSIEQSTQKLGEVMDSSSAEIDTAQVEIDQLLNEI